ncbi:MAG: transporter associated domain-containing protein, partial [Pseudonocardiaceae bacterium]
LDGLLHRDDIKELTGIELPEGPFATFAGFVISQLGRTPEVGDSAVALGHRFTVTEMDQRRVARIRITPVDDQVDAGTEGA